MTEIPEHLLKRSRERQGPRPPGEAKAAEAPAARRGGGVGRGGRGRRARPQPVPHAPAPGSAAPKPDPPYVAAAKRRRIPWWAMPVIGLPLWAFMYAASSSRRPGGGGAAAGHGPRSTRQVLAGCPGRGRREGPRSPRARSPDLPDARRPGSPSVAGHTTTASMATATATGERPGGQQTAPAGDAGLGRGGLAASDARSSRWSATSAEAGLGDFERPSRARATAPRRGRRRSWRRQAEAAGPGGRPSSARRPRRRWRPGGRPAPTGWPAPATTCSSSSARRSPGRRRAVTASRRGRCASSTTWASASQLERLPPLRRAAGRAPTASPSSSVARAPGLPVLRLRRAPRDLDQLVAENAVKAGATLWQGTEAVAPVIVEGSCGARW